jgi:hypothetical protein
VPKLNFQGLTPAVRFHIVVGARVAMRSFAVLFCAIIAWFMLQMDPAGAVSDYARSLFSCPPTSSDLTTVALLTFLLPAWAAPRLSLGLSGWMRHLPLSDRASRRGLELALVIVQMPVILGLGLLGIVAWQRGVNPWKPAIVQFGVLVSAGALAALPVRRRWVVLPAALAGGAAALASWKAALVALPLLIMCEQLAGPVRNARPRRRTPALLPFSFQVAWRALGWRVPFAYAASLLPVLASVLFAVNSALEGSIKAGAFRMGFGVAFSVLLALLAEPLAVRRPPWPWARSLPWSSGDRVLEDALFFALHALPLLAAEALIHPGAAAAAASLVPLLSLRASGIMRRAREKRLGVMALFVEGCSCSALQALVPWTTAAWLAAAPLAYRLACASERSLKATRWLEAHHQAAGDTLSWSE